MSQTGRFAKGNAAFLPKGRLKSLFGGNIMKQKSYPQHKTTNHSTSENGFLCEVCGRWVTPEGAGSRHRNHCPYCLHSLHLDTVPGDRASACGGRMEPIAVWSRRGGEWAIIHRCQKCGALRSNRIAADDNLVKLLAIAAAPLAAPPVPAICMGGELPEEKYDSGCKA